MPLDYQQILMEMNRPRKRQGRSFGKIAVWLIAILVIGGGGYAVWHYSLIGRAGETIAALWSAHAPSWMPGSGQSGDAAPVDLANAGAAGQGAGGELSLIVPGGQPAAAQAPAGALDIVAASRPDTARQSQPAAPVGQTNVNVKPQPAAPAPAPAAARQVSTPPAAPRTADAAATPVLSEAKAQLKSIDELLRSDPAAAMQRLAQLASTVRLQPDEAADVGYRFGYAARMLKDEDKAEKSWMETVEKFPDTRGGRYAALALADTWFRQFAGQRPQFSRWDDVQLMYSRVLGTDDAPFLPLDVKAMVKKNLTHLNNGLFFGSAPTKMARYHKVEPGELLGSIAGQYRVDYESLARINGVDPNRIRAGMDLKVVVGEVSIVVRKNSANPDIGPTVTWYLDGRWVREYPACVGPGDKTPAGTYNLTSKERDPSWTNPANGQLLPNDHPENILGSRWMAMKGMNTQGLGIHGTTVDDSIPGYTSAGCVRLHNRDVEELFSFARIGAPVTIIE